MKTKQQMQIKCRSKKFPHLIVLLVGLIVPLLSVSFISENTIPDELTTNLRTKPIGIDSNPTFSWDSQLETQTAYQIQVATSPENLNSAKYVWDSGKISSSQDLQVNYEGPKLISSTRYYWQVHVWNETGVETVSQPSWWETGLLNKTDWEPAEWIGGRQPQDHDWADMTTTVKFRVADAVKGMAFLFHAEPIGKTWGEAYSWKINSESGKTTSFNTTDAGRKTIYVKDVDNFEVGDDVIVGDEPSSLKIINLGTPATSVELTSAANVGATTLEISSAGNLKVGDIVVIGTGETQESVKIASVEKPSYSAFLIAMEMPADMEIPEGVEILGFSGSAGSTSITLSNPLSDDYSEGTMVACTGTGITFADPLTKSHKSNSDVKAIGKVQLVLSTNHYSGNTGVPEPNTGDPAIEYGVNYFDPQSEVNPTPVGTRVVEIATISKIDLGGITCDNLLTEDHNMKVQVEGNTITTWLNGNQVDQRTLTGDQLRRNGSIGFVSGSNAIIRNVKVDVPENSTTKGFYTDFKGGINPFEDGIVCWTGINGNPETDGLILSAGKGVMLPIANPAPLLRKEFEISSSPVTSARLYVTGGSYPKVTINGISVTIDGELPDEFGYNIPHLTPDDGQSESFILYNTFDVTKLLKLGKTNVIGAELGRGWTGVTVPGEWYWNLIPAHADPRTKAKLVITHDDGTVETIVTDNSWNTTDGPTTFDSVYTGEKYDARKADELNGWENAGYDDKDWNSATVVNPMGSYYGTGLYHDFVPATGDLPDGFIESKLKAMENEPIVVRDVMKPTEILETYPGSKVYLFKFDQMHTGWQKLNLQGITPDKAGLTLRMRGDNLITGSGTNEDPYVLFDSKNFIAGSLQTDYYTLSDKSEQIWTPSFHYNGQGAIEIHGLYNVLGREPNMEQDAELIVSEIASSGFPKNQVNTSNELLNRIQSLSEWTILNNAHGHPTDTPSREKNGWTGDGWADAEAWMLNFDVSQFYRLWVRDMANGMNSNGDLNVVMPGPRAYGFDDTPGWSTANGAVPAWDHAFFEVPLNMYQYYGDLEILKEIYPDQTKFMNYYADYFTEENNYTFSNMMLGEYAAGTLGTGSTENINHQLYYRMADYMSNVSALLGKNDIAQTYRTLANKILKAFIKLYWDETTHSFQKGTSGNLETEQLLAVAYDLVPGNDLSPDDPRFLAQTSYTHAQNKESCMSVVANSIKANGNRIGTGIYGLRYLFNLLDEYGYTNLAYSIATGLENPSWGNVLLQGGTTLQENWGGINGNHHYHSSILTWYYQGLAGIKPSSPGYATIQVKPYVPTNTGNINLKGEKAPVTKVDASINTARGLVKSSWNNDANFTMTVTIPSNTPAEIWVPSVSGKALSVPEEAKYLKSEEGYAVYSVGAGNWTFTANSLRSN